MIYKRIEISEIIGILKPELIRIVGQLENVYIDNLADVDNVNEQTLDWVNPQKLNKQQIVENSKARCLLVDEDIIYSDILKEKGKDITVVLTELFEIISGIFACLTLIIN